MSDDDEGSGGGDGDGSGDRVVRILTQTTVPKTMGQIVVEKAALIIWAAKNDRLALCAAYGAAGPCIVLCVQDRETDTAEIVIPAAILIAGANDGYFVLPDLEDEALQVALNAKLAEYVAKGVTAENFTSIPPDADFGEPIGPGRVMN